MLVLTCKKCGGLLVKKGVHGNDKQRYLCTSCGFRSVEYDIVNSDEVQQPELNTTYDGPDLNIVSTSSEIRTLEQLIKYCRVDLDKWMIKKHTVNSWGNKKSESFQVKAWLTEKVIDFDVNKEIEYFNKIAKNAPVYPKIKYSDDKESGNMLEISLYDHHFGQLSWGEETGGDNYDVKIAEKLALDCIGYFANEYKDIQLDKILIVAGNDFYNCDNSLNQTFGGTPQSEDDRWQKTYTKGWELWVKIIDILQQLAPVEVKCISGNHDQEKIYYMGETLRAWYNKCDNVVIDNAPTARKYFKFGNVLLGFTHGHKEVKGSLVNIMATEKPIEWSETRFREWHKGHLHHNKAHIVNYIDESHGVREEIFPSLVPLDDWHAGKGYNSLRQSIAILWNKETGKKRKSFYTVDK